MTQTDIPTWFLTFQLKLMAALDAAWAILEGSDDPAEIRRARDRAKAVGELAAVARKVALAVPAARKPVVQTAALGLSATQGVANLQAAIAEVDARRAEVRRAEAPPPQAPPQAEIARRALDKLKARPRGRL